MKKTTSKIVLSGVVVVVAVWLGFMLSDNVFAQELIAQFGYVGIFLVSIVSGFNVVVPIPIIAFFPLFIAAGHSTIVTVLTIALGMTLGDSLGYLIGNAGRTLFSGDTKNNKIFLFVEQLRHRYTWIPLVFLFFYAGFAPTPNELIVIPMAFIGYRFRAMIPILFAGNILFNTLIALGFLAVL